MSSPDVTAAADGIVPPVPQSSSPLPDDLTLPVGHSSHSSQSSDGASSQSAAQAALDAQLVESVTSFLRHACPPLLHAHIPAFLSALNLLDTHEVLQSFITDPSVFTLIVHRIMIKTAGVTAAASASAASEATEQFLFSTSSPSSLPAATLSGITSSIAFIKHAPALDPSVPLSSQLYACTLQSPAMFDTILAYVRHLFLPFSRAVSLHPDEQKDGAASASASSASASSSSSASSSQSDSSLYKGVSRKLGELEVELLRFQESVDIPFITLELHPTIAAFMSSCQKAGRPPRIDDFGPEASDAGFLNEVQRGLNEWKRSILRVTRLTRDVNSGSVQQEVGFWLSMERAVNWIYEQKESPGVELTFALLRHHKRFLATTGFMQDVGMSEEGKEKDRVVRYAAFLRDLPIKRLLAATDLTEVQRALELVFHHLKQIKRVDYPLSRMVALLQALSRDTVSQLQSILNSRHLMSLPYDDFVQLLQPVDELWSSWTARVQEMADVLRSIAKKKTGESIARLSEPYTEWSELRSRLMDIRRLRKEHEELRVVIADTLSSDAVVRSSALDAIHTAYSFLSRDIDPLSITAEGKEAWAAALSLYNGRVDRVESDLEAKIRELLDAAKDDSIEMFRVCARFNPLFVRPRIQAAIREYQEQLISTVKKDIAGLQRQFHDRASKQEARVMSAMHDLPPLSASILWSRQIERQLEHLMTRVEQVLGKQWHHHLEGRQLKRDSDDFRLKLRPQKLFAAWLAEKQEQLPGLQVKGHILTVVPAAGGRSASTLSVNFHRGLVTLFKEVRVLSRLELKLPFDIVTAADEARQNFPFAMRLEEALRLYGRACERTEGKPELQLLSAGLKLRMQESISRGVQLQWLDSQVKPFVDALGTQAVEFAEQLDELSDWTAKAEAMLGKMREAKVEDAQQVAHCLHELQQVVDHLDKRGYSNLTDYVQRLDAEVEKIIVKRLRLLMEAFVSAVSWSGDATAAAREEREGKEKQDDDDDDAETGSNSSKQRPVQPSAHYAQLIFPSPITHELLIRNQMLTVEPPLEKARLALVRALHSWLSTLLELPRLRLDTLTPLSTAATTVSTYRPVIAQADSSLLRLCLSAIEAQLAASATYVDSWLQYQALWDLDLEAVVAELGGSLPLWERLLIDMKRARVTFDSSEDRRRFGPVLVDFSSVQQKVGNKYDAWHRNVLQRFGLLLGERMLGLFSALRQGREMLEKHALDFSGTAEIVDSVTLLQGLRLKAEGWKAEVAGMQSVEQLLQRQRYHFPSDWLFSDRVEGEWKAFEQILQRKLGKMADEAVSIQQKLGYEDMELERRIRDYQADWKKTRPVRGDIHHKEVETVLNVADVSLGKLELELQRLTLAKQALNMPVKDESRLQPIREELSGLKAVWGHLSLCWRELDELQQRFFRETKPSDIRRTLTRLQQEVNALPNAMRSYEAFEYLRSSIRQFLSLNASLVELHSGVLRPKHEKQILKELSINTAWSELTVGQLWATDLKAHQKQLQAILTAAQGESALEEFLHELREQWEVTRLETVQYKGGQCLLIRNWDALFQQLSERLSDLAGMKQSPFFKSFEREALQWEGKLNAAQGILDVFIEVQRRWVYLEAIFSNSADVQQQLASQYKKFRAFDREFVRLMRDIAKEPQLELWVKEERQLQQELDAYHDTLSNIQKALGEYLEKQRAAFPRFFFIGDEDLLEIIGNAKNPLKVVRHLSKMFAGVEALELQDGARLIDGMRSREGELVRFVRPVEVDEGSVHAWLREVEYQMRYTLAVLLQQSIAAMNETDGQREKTAYAAAFFSWIDRYPAQIVLLSQQVQFSMQVDAALSSPSPQSALSGVLTRVENALDMLADRILLPSLSPDCRKKYEQLITEKVHQRDAVRLLVQSKTASPSAFAWLQQMRYYFTPYTGKIDPSHASTPELNTLEVRIARASFSYGFEYLGVSERLVQTPLTDRCYLTLAEALHMRLGGNPFGPAGTGKTETVKALGGQLGRFVIVFNCDEGFDFAAMGRIFVGLCQCGAWGCFDEFNRLEERILSAVSQQILTIQHGLKQEQTSISLLGKQVRLDPRVGLFVTMNPGYAGRSNLPDNLKQLFRSIAMILPDKLLIAQVMLYSQGFRSAEELSGKVVLLFGLCSDQLSSRSHYDFGLRALKSVLRSAGGLKRAELQAGGSGDASGTAAKEKDEEKRKEAEDERKELTPAALNSSGSSTLSSAEQEQALLVRSIVSTVVPKLVSGDVTLFSTLVSAVFPSATVSSPSLPALRSAISAVSRELGYVDTPQWTDKILQLYDISALHHGVIMVGPSGGKTSAWTTLRVAVERTTGVKVSSYVIDPKAVSKQELFGVLDDVTLEFTDGIFTHLLRRIVDNQRGEMLRQHWIVFDGDVDPEWAENLNSVLDDNRLLTLPNGERLALPPNVRILFEVSSLDSATPATVSRCGMVWFSEEVVDATMVVRGLLTRLRGEAMTHANLKPTVYARWRHVQEQCADIIARLIGFQPISRSTAASQPPPAPASADDSSNFLLAALQWSALQPHIMPLSAQRALMSLFSLFKGAIAALIHYDDEHSDFPLTEAQLEAFLSRYLIFAALWAFGGSLSLPNRLRFCDELVAICPPSLPLPSKGGFPLLEWEVRVESQDWELWEERVEAVELDSQKVIRADVVIDTVDTARHTDVISNWVGDHRPLLLVGPAGSGKSMTLTSVLRSLPEFELVTLNFSSTTTPKLILDTLNHHCKVSRTPAGLVMQPNSANRWLCLFADEINLPANDQYGTQHVITFLRQLAEQGGYWRPSDLAFVKLERVQIIGACNPPTDAGRVALSSRFLRHCPLVFVDFPALPSLRMIYGTFNRALLKLVPSLRSYADALTDAMIEVYSRSQARFTPDLQSHYVYSPRELSRWVRALYEAMKPPETAGGGGGQSSTMSATDLVRLWAHEALRLFQDRLVERSERDWTDGCIDDVARKHFPAVDLKAALARPILFSNWLTRQYSSVGQEALREHVKVRLRVFNEEELEIRLVIFDEVLEHILRIDRVLRQPLGHLLLVGTSGAGKTILSKFVAWMNGYSVFQIKVHKYYTGKDFDKDLRSVLLRTGCKDESICFIFDESNVLNTGFLERMNALLAGGEVPGLFEGQDYASLLSECKESARRHGLLLDTEEELYRHFIGEVQRRLHVVFTMNPANEDFSNRSATSPALFNRCVIDWFGEWSGEALYQVGFEFTKGLDLGDGVVVDQLDEQEQEQRDDRPPTSLTASSSAFKRASTTERDAVVSTLVYVHTSVGLANRQLASTSNGRASYVTPRHYLDFLQQFCRLFQSKRAALEEQQRHLNTGLRKLKETAEEVSKLQEALREKELVLRENERKANDKLEQMMLDKREAESKRDVSVQIGREISQQAADIQQRQQTVETELASAKPALDEAEAAVRNIKKTDLDQVSRYPNPPAPVKLALEAVVMMLGESTKEWEEIRKILRRSDFIKSVINFDASTLSKRTRDDITTKYLPDANFQYDVVYNASKACGPLVQWVASTINFSRIKNSVAPLEEEMQGLRAKQAVMERKQEELGKMQEELQRRIDQYKVEYSALIGEVERIKSEMAAVQVKVNRSMSLLANLSSERQRWQQDSDSFQTQLSTVVGDCLLSAAFLSYCGFFNQSYRALLLETWQDELHSAKVATKVDLSLIEYLSSGSERLDWQANALPLDDLCTENAIMLTHFNRYPLIIDPSGQATAFLMRQHRASKILRTSFLDDAFLKQLESALRFGNALLVEDVENLDPVLNSVLNREISRTGGRVMITLGDKEIDFSPSFTIFLSTRDPNCSFTPDLCSRVTLVNFTVTHSSLSSQCLSKILSAERPDIDAKRSDLLKLQGEFRVRLRELEDAVLNALAEQRGNILDDETVMLSLETLKREAAEVSAKMSESERVMEEISSIGALYRPFALASASVFFTLERLSQVHFLYHFSLPAFLRIVDDVLAVKQQTDSKDRMERLRAITRLLFETTYARVSRGLLNEDQTGFALRLIQIALDEAQLFPGLALDRQQLDFFMRGAVSAPAGKKASAPDADTAKVPELLALTRTQRTLLTELGKLKGFERLIAHVTANAEQWRRWMTSSRAAITEVTSADDDNDTTGSVNNFAPSGWESGSPQSQRHLALFQQMLIAKVFRPDRLPLLCHDFISALFSASLLPSSSTLDLTPIVTSELPASTPLLLVSKPGFDASSKVDALAAACSPSKYQSFAMGSAEGYEQADAAISAASKSGSWLLLKNVHLSPAWLAALEKRLHRLTFHPSFRLFLTMELNPAVPSSLLRLCHIVIFEPPVGVKASLQRIFSSLSPARVNAAPVERSRLYVLLAWLHSCVIERLRYTPVGWAKAFEFSETDALCAMDAVDEWTDRVSAGRQNISPDRIPWEALRVTLEAVMYGGRIDNEFDRARLAAAIERIFTPRAFDVGFQLADGLTIADVSGFDAWKAWVESLPDNTSPAVLGLPANAEEMLLRLQGDHIADELLRLQSDVRDVDVAGQGNFLTEAMEEEKQRTSSRRHDQDDGDQQRDTAAVQQPAWMLPLQQLLMSWLQALPTEQQLAESNIAARSGAGSAASLSDNPLFRCLQREHLIYAQLLRVIRADLDAAKAVFDGTAKVTNRVRDLLNTVRENTVPAAWKRAYTPPPGLSPSLFIADLAARLAHIRLLSSLSPAAYATTRIWLGALTAPEAVIAATRQWTSQSRSWPLEQLQLVIRVGEGRVGDFVFTGLALHCCQWQDGHLSLGKEGDGEGAALSCPLSALGVSWELSSAGGVDVSSDAYVGVPVYLYSNRERLLFSVRLPLSEQERGAAGAAVYLNRGACLTVWNDQQ